MERIRNKIQKQTSPNTHEKGSMVFPLYYIETVLQEFLELFP